MNRDNAVLGKFEIHFSKINEEMRKALDSRVELIEDMGSHTLLGDGKRLRPLLFVLSCLACNCRAENIYRLSTIFEYIHTASLLHDDVLDNAELRRNKASANYLWGNHAAVLVGDFLYSQSFCIAMEADRLKLFKRLTDTTLRMAEGQVLELMHTNDWDMSIERYLEIVTAKTAVLISAACACGAILSEAGTTREKGLSMFGLNTGIAFQLMDDLLDYTSTREEFGKPVGKDLKEGKITLPLIYALADLGKEERGRLAERFLTRRAGENEHREVIDFVRKSEAPKKIRRKAKSYAETAARALDPFEDSDPKRHLLELNDFVIERSR